MAANIKATLQLDTKNAQKGIQGVGTALKALATGAVAKGIFDLGNQFQEITNKLKAVTDSTEATEQAFASVASISKSTRSDLGATADLYFRLTKSAETLNLTQGETARVTELFAKTLKNSGATAQESASAILQFGQAMASGKLAGDEFRSLNETNSDLMDRLAKAMGKPRGELKKLASEGKITAEIIANALLESGDQIDATFGKTSVTLGESLTLIRNEFTILVGKLETQFGLFSKIAGALSLVSENLDIVAAAMAGAFAASVAGMIMNVVKAVRAFRAANQAAAASAVLLQAVTGVGLVKVGVGLAAAGATLAIMNSQFDEQAEKVGEVNDEVDRQVGSTKELVKEAENKADATKEEKEAATELARITKQQAEEFKSQLADLQTSTEEFSTQLDLRREMLSATDEEKAVLEEIAGIEEDRADAIKELNELTTISAADRQQREEEINNIYDARITKTKEQLALEEKISTAQESRNSRREFAMQLANMQNLMNFKEEQAKKASAIDREVSELNFKFAKEINEKEFALKDKFADLLLARQIELAQQNKTISDEEVARMQALYEEKALLLQQDTNNQMNALSLYIVGLRKVRAEQNTISNGIADSFAEFMIMVQDQAAYGKRIFQTLTDGFSSAILNFVETGKLSFKDLFKSLMTEIIKMQANKIFLALFSPEGMFGDLFAGLFNKGGLIPGGKFGIAGENGPEIINGPARVTSTAATAEILGRRSEPTQVIYNINAIDSRSFEARLAENPEYLYNVTQVGMRRQPR